MAKKLAKLEKVVVDPSSVPAYVPLPDTNPKTTAATDGDLSCLVLLPGEPVRIRERLDDVPGRELVRLPGVTVPLAIHAARRSALLASGSSEFLTDAIVEVSLDGGDPRTLWSGGPCRPWEVRAAYSERGVLLSHGGALLHLDQEGNERARLEWPRSHRISSDASPGPGRWVIADGRILVSVANGKLLAAAIRDWDVVLCGRGTMPVDGELTTDGHDVFVSSDSSLGKVRWMRLDTLHEVCAEA
ncbi:MAG: hypothetical protein JJ863_09640 [Deltaproteobacteria bacterium]|nr:hypothetical protein [Deltaproteobacteria bacterium]